MSDSAFLEKMVEAKRIDLAQVTQTERERTRLDALRARRNAEPHRFRRELQRADRMNVIAEVKRSSPSAGAIRAGANSTEVARAYERAGAAAISVLTEPHYFGGSLEDLRSVRGSVALPLLRKDFTIDEHHIYEAAAAGADAVLLIVAALTVDELRRLRMLAEDELGMDALVEVHTGGELEAAYAAGAKIVGVNNRNLSTLQVRVETSFELAQYLRPGVVVVSESGLRTAEDIQKLRAAGYGAFLIGETLMRSGDPELTLRGLMIEEVRRFSVKVCGITSLEDAMAAVHLGADMLGFNFYRKSPRYIDPARARAIVEEVGAKAVCVGVFVNEASPENVREIALAAGLGVVQLHGDETPEFCAELSDIEVIKVFRVGAGDEMLAIELFPVKTVLLDAATAEFGGSGKTFDWKIARQARNAGRSVMVAGGLNPENVAEAIRVAAPDAVDACSGLESAPGIKDYEKVQKFIAAVRAVEQKGSVRFA